MKYLLPLLFLGVFFANCNKDDDNLTYQQQLEVDEKAIEDYLAQNNLTAEVGDFGMRYIIDEPGEGANPTSTSTVIVKLQTEPNVILFGIKPTVVVPTGKKSPLLYDGVKTGGAIGQKAEKVGIEKLTSAPHSPSSLLTVIFEGQLSKDAGSPKLTIWIQVPVLL